AFVVQWPGVDHHAGLSAYDIYMAENDGAFTPWLIKTKLDSAIFYGSGEKRYAFYSVAYDWAGNKEEKVAKAEVEMAPSSLTATNPIATKMTKIYPNPTTGKVFLSFEESNKGMVMKVYDPIGRLVKKKSATTNDLVLLDLSDCASGLYYIHVEIGRQKTVQKVILSP